MMRVLLALTCVVLISLASCASDSINKRFFMKSGKSAFNDAADKVAGVAANVDEHLRTHFGGSRKQELQEELEEEVELERELESDQARIKADMLDMLGTMKEVSKIAGELEIKLCHF